MASPTPVLRLGARGSMLSKMQSQTVADAIEKQDRYAQFQPPAIAFQTASQKIFIEPRIKIPPVAETAEETSAHLRVDASLVLISANVSTDTGGAKVCNP